MLYVCPQNAAGRASIKGVALKGSGSSSWTDLTNDWGEPYLTFTLWSGPLYAAWAFQ